MPTKDSQVDELNRRPIRSRGLGFFQRMAGRIAKSAITPNMISVSSIVFAGLAGIAMLSTNWFDHGIATAILWGIAAIMIQARLIANLIDGMVAMEGGKATAEGELYNEVPDRISDALIFVGAGYSVIGVEALGWAAAVVSVFVAYVRAIGASVGAGQVFAGLMAKPQRMAVMTVCCITLAVMALVNGTGEWAVIVLNVSLGLVVVLGLFTAMTRLSAIKRYMIAQARSEESDSVV